MAIDYAQYENTKEKHKYCILLILTDGDISDIQATKDEIVKATEMPLSLIIIGIGDNEFSQMKV